MLFFFYPLHIFSFCQRVFLIISSYDWFCLVYFFPSDKILWSVEIQTNFYKFYQERIRREQDEILRKSDEFEEALRLNFKLDVERQRAQEAEYAEFLREKKQREFEKLLDESRTKEREAQVLWG